MEYNPQQWAVSQNKNRERALAQPVTIQNANQGGYFPSGKGKGQEKVGINKQREVTIRVRGQRGPLFKVRESPRAARDHNRKAGAHIRKGVWDTTPAVGRKPKNRERALAQPDTGRYAGTNDHN